MSIQSDLTVNASRFRPGNVTEATKQANSFLQDVTTKGPRWHEVGPATYREMRLQGKLALPAPTYLPGATDATIPSRNSSRRIPIRIYKPDNDQPSEGVFFHAHGGGWVLGDEKSSDQVLQRYANGCQLTAISVGYRHAPEDPYPAAVHDCIDVAEYLIDHPEEYGAVRFMGGESAGAYLVVLTTFHLLASRSSHALEGLALQYGLYDQSLGLPSLTTTTRSIMIDRAAMERFRGAFLPGKSPEECRDPSISPIYADLSGLAAKSPKGLPPALFVVGTDDPLLDDTILMGAKWSMAGAESIVKIYPGAAHGFTAIPGLPVSEEANTVSVKFVNDRATSFK